MLNVWFPCYIQVFGSSHIHMPKPR
jgi:hypothetical protein